MRKPKGQTITKQKPTESEIAHPVHEIGKNPI